MTHRTPRALVPLALLGLAWLSVPEPALAQDWEGGGWLRPTICNQGDVRLDIAYAFRISGGDFNLSGWLPVAPGSCEVLRPRLGYLWWNQTVYFAARFRNAAGQDGVISGDPSWEKESELVRAHSREWCVRAERFGRVASPSEHQRCRNGWFRMPFTAEVKGRRNTDFTQRITFYPSSTGTPDYLMPSSRPAAGTRTAERQRPRQAESRNTGSNADSRQSSGADRADRSDAALERARREFLTTAFVRQVSEWLRRMIPEAANRFASVRGRATGSDRLLFGAEYESTVTLETVVSGAWCNRDCMALPGAPHFYGPYQAEAAILELGSDPPIAALMLSSPADSVARWRGNSAAIEGARATMLHHRFPTADFERLREGIGRLLGGDDWTAIVAGNDATWYACLQDARLAVVTLSVDGTDLTVAYTAGWREFTGVPEGACR